MLYLFYDCAGMPWGYDPKDGAFKKVIYAEDTSELERKVAPFENNEAFAATSLKFANTTELPDLESDLVGDIEMSDDEIDAYWQMADDFCEQRSENKILGHSDNIQGGMELECELVTAFIAAALRIIAGWSLKNFGKISASGRCYYKSAVTTKTR